MIRLSFSWREYVGAVDSWAERRAIIIRIQREAVGQKIRPTAEERQLM